MDGWAFSTDSHVAARQKRRGGSGWTTPLLAFCMYLFVGLVECLPA